MPTTTVREVDTVDGQGYYVVSTPDVEGFKREWWINLDSWHKDWRIGEFTAIPSRHGKAEAFK